MPPTETPTSVPPTPTEAPPPAPVEAHKPAWARFNEDENGWCRGCYGVDSKGKQRFIVGETTYNIGLPIPKSEQWPEGKWGPVNKRVGRLIGVTDNSDGTVTLTLQFDEAGQVIETRWYALQRGGSFVYKKPLIVEGGPKPMIEYVDHNGDNLTVQQKMDLLDYYASNKMFVEVRADYDGTDFVIFFGLL